MVDYFRVANLEKWQHYKDRSPPWIKLHRDILTDYKFSCLQDASKAHLIAIWLLASQMDNRVPADPKWLANKINSTDPINLKLLIDNGFIEMEHDASNALADCKQDAMRETEESRDREETEKRQKSSSKKTSVNKPDSVDQQIWDDFQTLRKTKKAPLTETALEALEKEAQKAGITLNEALKISCYRGWQGFKAEWLKEANNGNQRQEVPRSAADRVRQNVGIQNPFAKLGEEYSRPPLDMDD